MYNVHVYGPLVVMQCNDLHIFDKYLYMTYMYLTSTCTCTCLVCNSAGVLIVSVQWRNKTFSGSLIDMNQHEWAPPRWVWSTMAFNTRISIYYICTSQSVW